MRGRNVRRAQSRGRSRADGLGRRRHQIIRVHVRWQALVHCVLLVLLVLLLSLVAPSRVGVVVDSRVTGQLVRTRELLAAARKLASVRLLASVGADVSGLVLEAVEGLVAQRALVRARQLAVAALRLGARKGPVWLNDGN